MTPTPLEEQINSVVRRLSSTLELPASDIEPEVRAAFAELDGVRVRDFLPILVERRVKTRRRLVKPPAA